MPWRRASDRLQRNGTILGFGLCGFAAVLKIARPETSDVLVLGILGLGGTFVHPSWLVDKVRAAIKPPEHP
jgi:hypothetical protein